MSLCVSNSSGSMSYMYFMGSQAASRACLDYNSQNLPPVLALLAASPALPQKVLTGFQNSSNWLGIPWLPPPSSRLTPGSFSGWPGSEWLLRLSPYFAESLGVCINSVLSFGEFWLLWPHFPRHPYSVSLHLLLLLWSTFSVLFFRPHSHSYCC